MISVLVLVGAPTFAADCNQVGNLLINCDFNTDLTGWFLELGQSWTHVPGDGGTAPGSTEVVAEFTDPNWFAIIGHSSCLAHSGAVTFDAGFTARLVSSSEVVQCDVSGSYYSDVACSSQIISFSSGLTPINDTWADVFFPDVAPNPSAQSLTFFVVCVSTASFTVRYDDTLFGLDLVPVELTSFSVE
jgi:hypothetical protein